jgi:hypothetical protein
MKPADVWVIYNDQSNMIEYVTSEKHMANRKLYWYWNAPDAPNNGSMHNQDKMTVLTLEDAVKEMKENTFYYTKT